MFLDALVLGDWREFGGYLKMECFQMVLYFFSGSV